MMARPPIDITGQRFGQLKVLKLAGSKHRQAAWLCVCSCGNTSTVQGSDLRGGRTKSCGCARGRGKRPKTHMTVTFGRGEQGRIERILDDMTLNYAVMAARS